MKLSPIAVVLALIPTLSFAAESTEQVRAGSNVCSQQESLAQIVIIDLENKLATLNGTALKPYPVDCHVIERNTPVTLTEFDGGIAVLEMDGTTAYTSKDNVILGEQAAAVELERSKCLKKVLELFCLGAEQQDLPTPLGSQPDIYVYEVEGQNVAVNLVGGRAARVTVFYPQPSWLKYDVMKSQLNEVYGDGINFDTFPEYADSETSRENAIRLERGRAMTIWFQDGWTVTWAWASNEYSLLSYDHVELSEQLRAQDLNRL